MAIARAYKHELKYDFFGLKKGETMAQAFPELLAYPEIEKYGTGKNDPWLRYAHLLTCKGSGLMKITDIEHRHNEALRLAGIAPDDERARAALLFTDAAVVSMCFALLQDSDSLMLAYVLAGERMLWQDVREMCSPIEETREEEPAPANETPAEAKARLNRAAWADGQNTPDKTQRARITRGTLFDQLPARIRALDVEKNTVFAGDKPLEKSVASLALRKGEGIVEKMVREAGK